MKLLIGVGSLRVYTQYSYRLYVVAGEWAITLGPWSRSSRYSNGSRWHSGWHRWRDEELEW